MSARDLALVALTATTAMLCFSPTPVRADLMSACAPEIQRFCSDVSRGRGRVSACLAGEMNRLSGDCLPQVQAVIGGFLTPGYVKRALQPGVRIALPQVCVAPAKMLCPAIPSTDGRVFACLYARSDRAGNACLSAAEASLKTK